MNDSEGAVQCTDHSTYCTSIATQCQRREPQGYSRPSALRAPFKPHHCAVMLTHPWPPRVARSREDSQVLRLLAFAFGRELTVMIE